MPTQYFCADCHLGFETGWYHFHRELNGAMAATLLACADCGSAYMLCHKYDGSRDEIYAWGGPVTWVPTEYASVYNKAEGTPEMTPVPCDHAFRPVRNMEKSARLEGILDELNFAGFACSFCGAVDMLTKEWPKDDAVCPRCNGANLQMVGSYMT